MLFALTKFKHLVQHDNPEINERFDQELLSKDEHFNTNEPGFMMAFGIEYFGVGTRNDPRYIKWVARHFLIEDGKTNINYIPLHPCTEEDFTQFYPPDHASASQVKKYK